MRFVRHPLPRPAVFLDKDGTLIDDVPYNVDPAHIRLRPGARDGVHALQAAGYALIVASNQSGVARGLFTVPDLLLVRATIESQLGLRLDGFYCCPHYPDGIVAKYAIACGCRKPRPGLLRRAASDLGLDLARSWMIGDIMSDVEAGWRAGCRTALITGDTTDIHDTRRGPTIVAADLADAARRIAVVLAGERSADHGACPVSCA
jgi:histidinol-phosphate phosphatase family protein